MLEVNISSLDAERKLGAIARDLGLSMQDMIVEQSRLAAQGCIQRTPPLSKSMKISQQAGRGAISRDLRRLFSSLETYQREGATSWTYIQTRELGIRMPDGGYFTVPFVRYAENTNQMATFHRRHRSKRTGHAFKVGNDEKMMVRDDRLLRRYRNEVYRRMGQLAAGWLPALVHFAGKSKISKGMRVPLFVKKAIRASGTFIDETGYRLSPAAVLTNKMRFGSNSKLESLVAQVAREREADATKWMRKRLRKLIEQRAAT